MIAIGAAISPVSAYSGGQYDLSLLVWKVRGSAIAITHRSSWCPYEFTGSIMCRTCTGSRPRQLVAGAGIRCAVRLLALVPVHPLVGACEHGTVRRRNREHAAAGAPHLHRDGQRTLCRGRLRESFLFPQLTGCGLGQ